jgi:hypothetical protein
MIANPNESYQWKCGMIYVGLVLDISTPSVMSIDKRTMIFQNTELSSII